MGGKTGLSLLSLYIMCTQPELLISVFLLVAGEARCFCHLSDIVWSLSSWL